MIQAAAIHPGASRVRVMSAGVRKMPDPMVDPMEIMVRSNSDRSRRSSEGGVT
jgi:hypothetical protein